MLVWLASYPRSGNTLLRQVLKTCFDLDSCEGLELVPEQLRDPDGIRNQHYGTYYVDKDWEEFYQKSRQSSELVLVKTHHLPRDDAKAIYVVRDGRLAIKSFVKFQDNYHPGTSSFMSLLLGHHIYGEWSSHYRAWRDRSAGPLLLLRFEELVNPSAELLAKIAEFIGVSGPVRPWVSHLDELRERHPAYFGSGEPAWKPEAFWTETHLRAFYTLHGKLLAKLGYATKAEVEAGAYPAGSDEQQLINIAHAAAANEQVLQAACDERLKRINDLTASCEQLTNLCGELHKQVELLAGVCKEREALIHQHDAFIQHSIADRQELGRIVHELDRERQSLEQRLKEAEAKLERLNRYTLLGRLSK